MAARKRELEAALQEATRRAANAEAALARTDDHRAVDVLRWARENGVYVSHVEVGSVKIDVQAVRQLSDDERADRDRERARDDRPRDFYEKFEMERRRRTGG